MMDCQLQPRKKYGQFEPGTELSQTTGVPPWQLRGCARKDSRSSGTPVSTPPNASHLNAKRPLCRHPSGTGQSSSEHPERKRRFTRHSSTMVHLSSTPASSNLCPHSHSDRCRKIHNPASDSQAPRIGPQEEMVPVLSCHQLGKSRKAHQTHPRTSSSNLGLHTQLHLSHCIRIPLDQNLQHRIEHQGSVQVS